MTIGLSYSGLEKVIAYASDNFGLTMLRCDALSQTFGAGHKEQALIPVWVPDEAREELVGRQMGWTRPEGLPMSGHVVRACHELKLNSGRWGDHVKKIPGRNDRWQDELKGSKHEKRPAKIWRKCSVNALKKPCCGVRQSEAIDAELFFEDAVDDSIKNSFVEVL